jgi:hypothetical protein
MFINLIRLKTRNILTPYKNMKADLSKKVEILWLRSRLPAHCARVKQWSYGLPISDSTRFDKHPKLDW